MGEYKETTAPFNEEALPSIEDVEEAKQYILELFEKGERPVVTIPLEYLDSLKEGLRPRSTWIFDFYVIAGTLGREAYKPEGRIKVRLRDVSADRVMPRFTGPDNKFHGVVVINGPINPEEMEIID